ncbi:MAG TPA: hypothetical protein VEH27_13945 [Methylomirabilota bacterium]|nr:hypothetical protein [Methylomirabilota bacterium]
MEPTTIILLTFVIAYIQVGLLIAAFMFGSDHQAGNRMPSKEAVMGALILVFLWPVFLGVHFTVKD